MNEAVSNVEAASFFMLRQIMAVQRIYSSVQESVPSDG
jgi:hypothetical protein